MTGSPRTRQTEALLGTLFLSSRSVFSSSKHRFKRVVASTMLMQNLEVLVVVLSVTPPDIKGAGMQSDFSGYLTDLTYTNHYYEHLSPVALNYLAGLNGYAPRNLADFDYCELGCGAGMSLLVHAAAHPDGRFVGIDLNPEHIEHASRIATEAGINNLRLIAEPVSDTLAQSEPHKFDFITLHGLYAWVSQDVRATICRFIAALLKPGGFVLVSYNARPGSSAREPLRDVMRRFAIPLSQNSLERAELGLSYLRVMLNARVPFFQLNPELEKYAESLFSRDLRYIAHEFFNEHWQPLAVDEVAGEMAKAGLRFAGSLPLWHNHPEADVPSSLTGLFENCSDRVAREAHKDFIYHTVFRTDLYAHPPAECANSNEPTLWRTPFCSAIAPDTVQFSVQRGALQLPLNTRESRIVFARLQKEALCAAELAEDPALASVSPQELVGILGWWALSGQIRPVANRTSSEAAVARCARLSRSLLPAFLQEPNETQAWLASDRFGVAFPFAKTDAMALVVAASTPPERRNAELCQLIRNSGLSVEESGQAMSDADLQHLAEDLYAELPYSDLFEQAVRLGIVVDDLPTSAKSAE